MPQGREPPAMAVQECAVRACIIVYTSFNQHAPRSAGVHNGTPNLTGFLQTVVRLRVAKTYQKSGSGTHQRNRQPRNGQPVPTENLIQNRRDSTNEQQHVHVAPGPVDGLK